MRYFRDENNVIFGYEDDTPRSYFAGKTEITEPVAISEANPTPTDMLFWQKQINYAYDAVMRLLQNGYSDEEVKTFTPKQDAIREYQAGGVSNLSVDNRLMLDALTGTTNDDAAVAEKMDNMAQAAATFKQYLGIAEKLRDDHLDLLVDGQDNAVVVDSLKQAYDSVINPSSPLTPVSQ